MKRQDTHPEGEKVLRYGIRKFKFGAASVAVAAGIMMGATAQAQDVEPASVELDQTVGAVDAATEHALEELPVVDSSAVTPLPEVELVPAVELVEPVAASVAQAELTEASPLEELSPLAIQTSPEEQTVAAQAESLETEVQA